MSSIKQYLAWADQRIAALVVAEGLHCGLLGVTQGPLVLTFRVRLLRPSPTALRKLLGLGPALSQALQCDSVRISEQPGHVSIEIPSPQPRTPSGEMLAMASRGLSIAVGLDAQRQPVRVNLQDHGALFWIGPSRRGKTQSMKSTLYALARRNPQRLRFAILCNARKLSDWQAFESAKACCGIVTDPAEQEKMISWAAGELMTDILHGDLAFVVAVDDLLNLLQSADLADSLSEISGMGAGVGCHLLAGTQEGGSKRGTGGAGVENNATAKVLYRNSSAAGAARFAGQGNVGVQDLSGAKGDALLLEDGNGQRIATGLADDRDILQLVQGDGLTRPWLHRATPVLDVPHAHTAAGANVGGAVLGGVGGVTSGSDSGVAAVSGGVAAVLDGEPYTDEHRALVRKVYAEVGSKNAACRALWGYKSHQTYTWLNECLAVDETPQETPGGKLKIDMNSDEGLAVVEDMRRSGLLPTDDITEVIRYH